MSDNISKNINSYQGDIEEESFESFLNIFTKKIDGYETSDWGTSSQLYSNMHDGISRLRREIAQKLNETNIQIFNNWNHKISFELTEKTHKDQQQLFKDLSWEESFVLSFLYFIYH